jgi:hypothetical protein
MDREYASTYWTPMEDGFSVGLKEDKSQPLTHGTAYRRAIGSLQYSVYASRPGIALAVALLRLEATLLVEHTHHSNLLCGWRLGR